MIKNRQKPGVIIIEGHVQGLANTRVLGRAGIPVIVIDKDNCIARYSRYCVKYFRCPDYITDAFIEFLIKLNIDENLKDWMLLPSNDHAVYNISKHKKKLCESFKIVTEDMELIDKIYNKRNLLNIAKRIGVSIPNTVMPVESNPTKVDLTYPIIIKGNNGLSFYKKFQQKAIVVDKEDELQHIWSGKLFNANPSDYFIQEVIPYINKTISVTIFAVKGIVHSYWMGVKLREHPLKFGTATCCKSIFEKELLDISTLLIQDLGYTGVCEIEWLKDSRDGQYKLIEINARTWLWVGLAEKCGIAYPTMLYNYANNDVLPQPYQYKLGLFWINLYTDIFFSFKRIINRIDKPQDVIRTYFSFTEACWDITDPIPFFAYGCMALAFLHRR